MRRTHHSIMKPTRLIKSIKNRIMHVLKYKYAFNFAKKSGQVYFYPERPHPYTAAYRALHLNGMRIRCGFPDKSDKNAILMYWEDTTFAINNIPDNIENICINRNAINIAKENVADAHRDVFGYGAEVEPTRHVGPMVVKSDENGTHSGRIVNGPIDSASVQPDHVYQAVINNSSEALGLLAAGSGMAVDFRVPIFRTVRDKIYIKYRPIGDRFSNTNSFVELVDTKDVLSESEISLINKFCSRMGTEYCEIDVVRDAGGGRIYILDVNKTPLGPPNGLDPNSFRDAEMFYRQEFRDLLAS